MRNRFEKGSSVDKSNGLVDAMCNAMGHHNIVWVVQHDGRTHSVWWSHFDAQTCADNIATLGVQTIIEQRHVGE